MSKAWTYSPLGEVAPACATSLPRARSKVWNLSLEDIEKDTGRILRRKYSLVADLRSSKCAFNANHVLYSKLRPYLNKVVLPDRKGVATSELIPLLPNPEILDREFLTYYLRSPQFREFSIRITRGANLPRIAMTEFWKHKVPTPSIAEQRRVVDRIVDALARVDEINSLFRDVVNELTELKHRLVLGGGKRDRPWIRLGDLLEWIQESEAVNAFNKYAFAGIRSFGKGMFLRGTINGDQFAYKSVRRLRQGDFVFPKLMAWEGAFAMVSKKFEGLVVSPEFVIFRPQTDTICSEVLDAYFRSPVSLGEVQKASTGSNRRRRRLNPKPFLNLMVPVPPLSDQEQLKAVYKLESAAEDRWHDRITELAAVRDSVLRNAFARKT